MRVRVTNGVDGNGDGMADDWAATYGITDPNGDQDDDGITNRTEYENGTNPTRQGSDGDDFSDQEEADDDTDAMNALVYGATISQPRLALEKNRLRFFGKDNGGLPSAAGVVGQHRRGQSCLASDYRSQLDSSEHRGG